MIMHMKQISTSNNIAKKKSKIAREILKNKYVYIMLIPVVLYYAIFAYKPMYGAIIAFKDFNPKLGIINSPWVGFENFIDFFQSVYFKRVLTNTLMINFKSLLFGFPAPIILALLINELRVKWFKNAVQTISYMPHFISVVVVAGMIKSFTGSSGIINYLINFLGGNSDVDLLLNPKLFQPIYILSDIWQGIGWGSIIYLAALAGVNVELYEAATIDGANRWQQTINITFPSIMPTIIIMLILRIGSIMNVGFEKIILLYNGSTLETADVISTYVYRRGLQEFAFSFSAAVGLFNSVINFILVAGANYFSKKMNGTSLW